MKKTIVIGGGFAGIKIAKALQKNKKFLVTLIDNKDYFEFTPSVPKVLANPNHSKKIRKSHKEILDCKIVIGEASIYEDKVIVNKQNVNKQKLEFDYLIIATGSTYNNPFKQKNILKTNRAEVLEKNYYQIKNSQKITIIGGGIVGVEVASELKEKYSEKEITIIHSQKKLIPRNNEEAIRKTTSRLKKLGVKLILEEKAVICEKNYCETDKGTKMNHDLLLMCTGIKPNSELVKIINVKDDREFLKTNNYLQLEGFENIFVAGDVTSIKEEKTAQNAEKQARIVINNIIKSEHQKPLKQYTKKNNGWMVISLGEHRSLMTNNHFSFFGIIPGLIKKLIEKKVMITK